MAVASVEHARKLCEDVEFTPMDTTRTEVKFLYQVIERVIEAGATTVNIADTVGYAIPYRVRQADRRHLQERAQYFEGGNQRPLP